MALLGGLVLGALGLSLFRVTDAVVPVTPWSLVGTLLVFAAAGAVHARAFALRVREARGSISPDEGVRTLVLGRVMLSGGTVLLGMHVIYVLVNMSRWSVPTPHERVVHGLVTIAACAAFAAAGRALENACRIDPGDGAGDGGDDRDAARPA